MFQFSHAIVRTPGPNPAAGLTTACLGPPDTARLFEQHRYYVDALRSLGLQVITLPPAVDYPDAYFVEDVAVVTPEVAVITRPGAEARRGEERSVAPVLARFRPTVSIQPPGTLDGGDVLIVDRRAFIGISDRTNLAGAEQLEAALVGHGYQCQFVPVGEGLHLKSSVNYVGRNTLILSKTLAARTEFTGFERLVVDPAEEYAANSLLVNDCLLIPQGFTGTRAKLADLGLRLLELDASEVRKMDGGLTCLSLRF